MSALWPEPYISWPFLCSGCLSFPSWVPSSLISSTCLADSLMFLTRTVSRKRETGRNALFYFPFLVPKHGLGRHGELFTHLSSFPKLDGLVAERHQLLQTHVKAAIAWDTGHSPGHRTELCWIHSFPHCDHASLIPTVRHLTSSSPASFP